MSRKNLIVGQSGGPTAVINSSLYGVVSEGMRHPEAIEHVYGMINGIEGFLNGTVLDFAEALPGEKLDGLKVTPGAYLGSCRYKLPESLEDPVYPRLFKKFEEMNIGWFFYIGGNDSMDTVSKLSRYAAQTGSDIRILGEPKTIDNDLIHTDHTPGFGSAAKYIGASTKEVIRDALGLTYKKNMITIMEIMGRNAGWLTGATALAKSEDCDGPDLIYLPEVAFDQEQFLADVQKAFEHTSNLVVCISEGINDGNGTFVCELASDVGTDTFGHKMLTGSGKYLENLVKEKLGIKVRSVELNVCQRCSSSCLSATDLDEAAASGRFAVSAALDGETGKMINFIRKSDDPYILEFGTADVNEICNKEKAVPEEWITKDGSDIGDEFIAYARPLIQGSVEVPMKDGLPYFAFRK